MLYIMYIMGGEASSSAPSGHVKAHKTTMSSAKSKWRMAISRSLSVDPNVSGTPSVDPNVSGTPKGVDMWAAAIARGTANAAAAGEAHVTHRPGAPGVVCGTLNLLGEDFNPFEFIATGDKEFMGNYEALLKEWEALEWDDVAPYFEALSAHASYVQLAFSALKAHCQPASVDEGTDSVVGDGSGELKAPQDAAPDGSRKVASYFNEEVLERDNKLLTDRVNLVTFALRPMLPATKAAMESGKVTKEEILRAALGLGQPEDEVLAMFNALDLDGDGTLDYEEFTAACRNNGPCEEQSDQTKRMATLAEMAAHQQWQLLLSANEVEDAEAEKSRPLTETRWFQELEALVVQADPTVDRPAPCASKKQYTYAVDFNLLVWDLCCCVLASRQREVYVAICRASHLNPDNTPAVVAQFLDVAQAQAAAWSRAEAKRASEAQLQEEQQRSINEEGEQVQLQQQTSPSSRELPLVLGLQEWPGSGSVREAVYRAACIERGLHVIAPGDDVALAWSANVLPCSRSGAGEVAAAAVEPSGTSGKGFDGHGAGWAALDLTSEGGWEGAAHAGAQESTADLTGAHYLHRKNSLRFKGTFEQPSVIDPTECMKTAIAEMESNLSADESLSDKDRTGLLKTTTAKTLVVLLVPPPPPPTPLPSESNAAATTVEAVPQTRLGLVTVVVHAKEPKTAPAARALAVYFNILVSRAQAAAAAFSEGGDSASGHRDSASAATTSNAPVGPVPSWVLARMAGADFSNFAVLSDTNLGKTKVATTFRTQAHSGGFGVRPIDPSVGTTSKRRSKLHGQTYDAAKCHVTVEAPKDVILTKADSFLTPPPADDDDDESENSEATSSAHEPRDSRPDLKSLSSGSSMGHPAVSHLAHAPLSATGEMPIQPVFPALHFFKGLFARTLPDSAWASDHCLVTAAIALEPPLPEPKSPVSINDCV